MQSGSSGFHRRRELDSVSGKAISDETGAYAVGDTAVIEHREEHSAHVHLLAIAAKKFYAYAIPRASSVLSTPRARRNAVIGPERRMLRCSNNREGKCQNLL